MSDLDLDQKLISEGGTATGSVVGGMLGAWLAGPVGVLLGMGAGSAAGTKLGQKLTEKVRQASTLSHFEKIFQQMPYYVPEMEWMDYEPAYRYALDQYPDFKGCMVREVEEMLEDGWEQHSGLSHLTWPQARRVVEHVWSIQGDLEALH